MAMRAHRQNGFVGLIAMLVVVAIVLMLYSADLSIIGGGERGRNYENPKDQPWANESAIDANKPKSKVKASAKPKVKIDSEITLQGPVMSDQDKRGQVTIMIDPNGTCRGSWHCAYSYTHAAYVNDATFSGNTIENGVNDASGKPDTSKLAFVTRGDFTQKSTNLDTGEVTMNKGTVYVNGEINAEHTAQGKVSITTNKNWHGDYTFTATPQR